MPEWVAEQAAARGVEMVRRSVAPLRHLIGEGVIGGNRMFQHILVPLDGSASSERAVSVAARLAHAGGGIVTLLRVIHPYWEPDAAIAGLAADDTDAMDAADYLAEVRQSDVLADVASFAAISVGSVVHAILKAAEDGHAELIVLCQHRHSPLVRWVRSGIAEQVARRAPVPVLVLHEHDRVPAPYEAELLAVRR